MFQNGKNGKVLVSYPVWEEFCIIGHWIHDSILMRWAELSHQMAHGDVPISVILETMLRGVTNERDVSNARLIYDRHPEDLICVWSGKVITGRYDVDHVIPYSLWHNNSLWNLMPSDPRVNNDKRDKLPSSELLNSSRDRLIHYWRETRSVYCHRFDREYASFTGKSPDPNSWERTLFSSLFESVETVAIQRGVERYRLK